MGTGRFSRHDCWEALLPLKGVHVLWVAGLFGCCAVACLLRCLPTFAACRSRYLFLFEKFYSNLVYIKFVNNGVVCSIHNPPYSFVRASARLDTVATGDGNPAAFDAGLRRFAPVVRVEPPLFFAWRAVVWGSPRVGYTSTRVDESCINARRRLRLAFSLAFADSPMIT